MSDAVNRLRAWRDGSEAVRLLPFTYTAGDQMFADDVINLLAERDAAQAEVKRLRSAEVKRLREAQSAWLRVIQEENSCPPTGKPCDAVRCGCAAEQEMLIREARDDQ